VTFIYIYKQIFSLTQFSKLILPDPPDFDFKLIQAINVLLDFVVIKIKQISTNLSAYDSYCKVNQLATGVISKQSKEYEINFVITKVMKP